MRIWADFTIESGEGGAAVVALHGPLRVFSIGDIDRRLEAVQERVARIDLSQVSDIDTAGAWIAWRFARDWGAEITGQSDEARRLIAAVSQARGDDESFADRPSLPVRVSGWLGNRIFAAVAGTKGCWAFSAR